MDQKNLIVIFHYFGQKMTESQDKKYTGKTNFEILGFKYVLKHSESISTKKNFDQNCLISQFFHHFDQKMKKSTKKFCYGKIFSISRFTVWNTFWNILNRFRPIFRPKFFDFVIFFHYFGHFGRKTTKSHEKNFTREKIFDFEIFV